MRIFAFLLALLASFSFVSAAAFNGVSEYGTDDHGYYYAITGSKFVNGQTVNGDNGSGGAIRFVTDDPVIWSRSVTESGIWQKDDWFPEHAGFALTMKNSGVTVYDNNGIEDNTYGDFYSAVAQGTSNANTPGLYRGYSMSNNFDWIYAGYFKIETETTIDELVGYFDENSGFNRNNPIVKYRMNIWSNVNGDLLPVDTGSFDGDVLSSDSLGGTFTTSDTGVDRVFSDNTTDDIFRLTYTPSSPITLAPGEYWFGHDAAVPEPSVFALFGFAVLAGLKRFRR